MSNLKQLAKAHLVYASDHGDALPPAQVWTDATEPYAKDISLHKDHNLYQCPNLYKENPRGHGYAFHLKVSQRKLATVKRPESVVLLYDSTRKVRNASDNLQSLPRPGRHYGEKNVFAYTDGHVKVR